ncbi:MAG: class I SAM-dependent methyltransferase [Acidobacteria bacterium]|nr:class I SAM-dependent methyltransferase [Acidobacteriota bacterium]MBI3655117.1 class I SAM-dependent methyltransferase [Acidobacteriota bacterium]
MDSLSAIPIDRVKEFWNRRPCNVRHSPQPVGTRRYFDEVEARKYFVEPHISRFAQFERWRGKRVLEIGCGLGTDTIKFAQNGAWVTAVDLSEKSLEVARQRAQVYGLQDRIQFYCGNAETLDTLLPTASYDLVYSFGVIHHTPHPERVIAQIRQFVHPSSTIKIMIYYRWAWKALEILLTHGRGKVWRWAAEVARHSEAQTGCPITYTYTRRQARALLERHGFQTTEMELHHIFPYRIPDYTQYRYVKTWYFRPMPPALFHWLEKHYGWHLCLTVKPQE